MDLRSFLKYVLFKLELLPSEDAVLMVGLLVGDVVGVLSSSKELTDLQDRFFFAPDWLLSVKDDDLAMETMVSSSAPKILTVMVTPLLLTITDMSSSYTMLGLLSKPSPEAMFNVLFCSICEVDWPLLSMLSPFLSGG